MIKLNLSRAKGFTTHRSGWKYCIDSLLPFHSRGGIFVDDFVERAFCWKLRSYYEKNNEYKIPYKFPWIGFVHNPPRAPQWFDYYNSTEALFKRPVFLESLKTCRCLITLSTYLKKWIESKTDVPVISIKHPTETPPRRWNLRKFLSDPNPRLIQIGYWLRKMDSIANINAPRHYKRFWLPSNIEYASEMANVHKKTLHELEGQRYRWHRAEKIDRVSNDLYDDWMSSSVVFLDLYDSSANNAIIESIARNTPILVNRIEPVVEYLGKNYPLYFDNLDHAAQLLDDKENIYNAHVYLKSMDKKWIKGSYFSSELTRKLKEIL